MSWKVFVGDWLARLSLLTLPSNFRFLPPSLNKKSPSLHSEERAPHQLYFPRAQFLAADQQGVQTHNSRSKHQVNLLGNPFDKNPKYLFLLITRRAEFHGLARG